MPSSVSLFFHFKDAEIAQQSKEKLAEPNLGKFNPHLSRIMGVSDNLNPAYVEVQVDYYASPTIGAVALLLGFKDFEVEVVLANGRSAVIWPELRLIPIAKAVAA